VIYFHTPEPVEAPRTSGFDLAPAIERCAKRAGLKHEALAALQGYSSQQWSNKLAGREHVSMPKLLSVASDPDGRRFLQYLWIDIAEYLDIEDYDALALQLRHFSERFQLLVDKVQVRMVKSDLDRLEAGRKRA
jgi:hypothetical protein